MSFFDFSHENDLQNDYSINFITEIHVWAICSEMLNPHSITDALEKLQTILQ